MSDLKAKTHKIQFLPGPFRPDPAGGAYSTPKTPIVVFKGLHLRRGRERGRIGEKERRRLFMMGREGR